MKTKLIFAVILSCCLIGLFGACQNEKIDATITEISTKSTIENYNKHFLEKLPNTVFVESIKTTTIPKSPDLEDYPFPIDTSIDCRYSSCFQLTDTYEQIQRLANLSCQSVKREICCCLNGTYGCFLIKVLPNQFCQDTSKMQLLEAKVIDKIISTNLGK